MAVKPPASGMKVPIVTTQKGKVVDIPKPDLTALGKHIDETVAKAGLEGIKGDPKARTHPLFTEIKGPVVEIVNKEQMQELVGRMQKLLNDHVGLQTLRSETIEIPRPDIQKLQNILDQFKIYLK